MKSTTATPKTATTPNVLLERMKQQVEEDQTSYMQAFLDDELPAFHEAVEKYLWSEDERYEDITPGERLRLVVKKFIFSAYATPHSQLTVLKKALKMLEELHTSLDGYELDRIYALFANTYCASDCRDALLLHVYLFSPYAETQVHAAEFGVNERASGRKIVELLNDAIRKQTETIRTHPNTYTKAAAERVLSRIADLGLTSSCPGYAPLRELLSKTLSDASETANS